MKARTHDFAAQLLRRPDKSVRALVWGRLVLIWDSKRTSTDLRSTSSEHVVERNKP